MTYVSREFTLSVLVLLLTIGLVARATRFVTTDYLTRHVRALVIRYLGPDNDIAYLLACPWCLSVWLGGGFFTTAWYFGDTPTYFIVAATGTASYLTGVAATWFDPTEGL